MSVCFLIAYIYFTITYGLVDTAKITRIKILNMFFLVG